MFQGDEIMLMSQDGLTDIEAIYSKIPRIVELAIQVGRYSGFLSPDNLVTPQVVFTKIQEFSNLAIEAGHDPMLMGPSHWEAIQRAVDLLIDVESSADFEPAVSDDEEEERLCDSYLAHEIELEVLLQLGLINQKHEDLSSRYRGEPGSVLH